MVTIRSWEWSDAKRLATLINNKNIWNNVRDILPHPYSLTDAESFLQHSISAKTTTNFAVLLDGEVVGGIGFIPKEDVYKYNAEIGYWIAEPYWGKGVGTAAIGAVVEKIREVSPLTIRVYAEIFAHNTGSMRALEKNGFVLESVRRKNVVKNGIIMDDHVYVLFLEK
jgi:GNAT superfamily N-acetyltransferase